MLLSSTARIKIESAETSRLSTVQIRVTIILQSMWLCTSTGRVNIR